MASVPDAEISSMVDTILSEDDRNNDGFIDYTEFQLSQGEGETGETNEEKKDEGNQ